MIEIGGTQYTVGTDPVPSGYGTHGTVTLPNGSGFMFQNFDTFSSSGPVCFATGTLISTPTGLVAVENLKVGNQISTREGLARDLLWIGKFDVHFNAHNAHHRPIEFKRGSLGANIPATTLTVSPQHRILIRNPTGQEVLAPAKAFTDLPKIRVSKGMRKVTYHALLLDVHSVILANGAEVESFFPGEHGMDFVGPMLRRQTCKALQNGAKYRDQGARPFVSVQSARQYLSTARRSAWSPAVAHRTAARDALPKAG